MGYSRFCPEQGLTWTNRSEPWPYPSPEVASINVLNTFSKRRNCLHSISPVHQRILYYLYPFCTISPPSHNSTSSSYHADPIPYSGTWRNYLRTQALPGSLTTISSGAQFTNLILSRNGPRWANEIREKELTWLVAKGFGPDYSELLDPQSLYDGPGGYDPISESSSYSSREDVSRNPWLPWLAKVFYNERRPYEASYYYCQYLALVFLLTGTLFDIDPLLYKRNFINKFTAEVEIRPSGEDIRRIITDLKQGVTYNISKEVKKWWKDIRRLSKWGTNHDWEETGHGQVPGFVPNYLAFNSLDSTAADLLLTLNKMYPYCVESPTFKTDQVNPHFIAQKLRYRVKPYYNEQTGWINPLPPQDEITARLGKTRCVNVGLSIAQIGFLAFNSDPGMSARYHYMLSAQNGTEEYPLYFPMRYRLKQEGPCCTLQFATMIRNGWTKDAAMIYLAPYRDHRIMYRFKPRGLHHPQSTNNMGEDNPNLHSHYRYSKYYQCTNSTLPVGSQVSSSGSGTLAPGASVTPVTTLIIQNTPLQDQRVSTRSRIPEFINRGVSTLLTLLGLGYCAPGIPVSSGRP